MLTDNILNHLLDKDNNIRFFTMTLKYTIIPYLIMTLFMQKYLQRISKQGFLNFAGTNPKLVTFVIGLGIAVAFTSFGRIFHEALIGSASAFTVTPPEHMPKDEVLHFPV